VVEGAGVDRGEHLDVFELEVVERIGGRAHLGDQQGIEPGLLLGRVPAEQLHQPPDRRGVGCRRAVPGGVGEGRGEGEDLLVLERQLGDGGEVPAAAVVTHG